MSCTSSIIAIPASDADWLDGTEVGGLIAVGTVEYESAPAGVREAKLDVSTGCLEPVI